MAEKTNLLSEDFDYREVDSDEIDGTVPIEEAVKEFINKTGAKNAIIMLDVPCESTTHKHESGDLRATGLIAGDFMSLATLICTIMDKQPFVEEVFKTAVQALKETIEERKKKS